MTDYTVIHGPVKANVISSAKVLLADGWVLQGGISVAFVDNEGVNRTNTLIFAQALIKIT